MDMQTVHPLREALHNEVHARPYERLSAPLALTHVGWAHGDGVLAKEHVNQLLRQKNLPLALDDANHISTDLGGVLLRWEKHSEFHTATFWRPITDAPNGFEAGVLPDAPRDWLQSMPGQWLIGLHVLVLRQSEVLPDASGSDLVSALVRRTLDESTLVAARVMDGQVVVYTDFRLHADGFGRCILVVDDSLNPRRLGRAVQRVLEVETYRMMSLLGLPAAREVGGALVSAERELAEVAEQIRFAQKQQEPDLLRRLTHLAAQVESLYARTHARFSASAAYFELVQRRIQELREERIHGLQTLGEFMDRRLSPAMQTCAWAARRQQALSERISRTSNLLRTRVEIEQQQSSQFLLDAMNRRQEAQLLLQSAVEGLSVAAITYYGTGLVGYVVKGLKSAGLPISPDMAIAVAVPLIAGVVWLGLRRMHHKVMAGIH
ncbi:uncharacterized membrane-anchored protein [Leptothrix ochracea L12]|uniref:Uncharacterized membrane-anchored protein n=1 Tax=Leptothrix ochracea L12 TaxID=735332 RepID=I4Z577_9BURK|nr:DUF3422 domain-containing protein [Leptothrix ochracea]EIM31369.1 uncharacterized membrane-anchored protein [Leptothrix ochracea L12]